MEKICHRYECQAAFADTDASGRVHFSKILGYVEKAEHEFLSSIGIVVFAPEAGGWPRVKINCDFKSSLRFGDRLEVRLGLSKLGNSSLNWRFEIVDGEGVSVASGEMVTVKVGRDGSPCPVSDNERGKLEGFL